MNAQQMFWSNHFATNYPYYRDWGAEKLAQAEAASRAISRHTCCKSQFKFKCFSCGEHVQRGDLITVEMPRMDLPRGKRAFINPQLVRSAGCTLAASLAFGAEVRTMVAWR